MIITQPIRIVQHSKMAAAIESLNMSEPITSSDIPDSDKPVSVDSMKIENIKSDINLKGMLMTQTWTDLASLLSRYQAELVSWESRLLISNARTDISSLSSHVSDDVTDLKNRLRRYEVQLEQCEQKLQLSQHNHIKQTEQVMKLQSQVFELSDKNLHLNATVTKLNLQVEIYKKKKHKKKRKEEPYSPLPENGDLIIDEGPLIIKEEMDDSDEYGHVTMPRLAAENAPILLQEVESPYYINHLIDYEENEGQSPDDVTQPLYASEPIRIKQEPPLKRKRSAKKKEGPECPVCSKCCGNDIQLQQHMLLHSKDRPFMCQSCGWRFQRRENLIAHSRVHSGERPYKCDQCCRAFTQISARRRHMKTAHGTEPEKKQLKVNEFTNSIAEILSNIEIIPAIDPDSSMSRPEASPRPETSSSP